VGGWRKFGCSPHWEVWLYTNLLRNKVYGYTFILLINTVYSVSNSLKGSGFVQEPISAMLFAIKVHGLNACIFTQRRQWIGRCKSSLSILALNTGIIIMTASNFRSFVLNTHYREQYLVSWHKVSMATARYGEFKWFSQLCSETLRFYSWWEHKASCRAASDSEDCREFDATMPHTLDLYIDGTTLQTACTSIRMEVRCRNEEKL
jgi:hypothetical protein